MMGNEKNKESAIQFRIIIAQIAAWCLLRGGMSLVKLLTDKHPKDNAHTTTTGSYCGVSASRDAPRWLGEQYQE